MKRRQLCRRYVLVLQLILFLLLAPMLHAQGGPPFRTDDPDTPGSRQWEINIGWIGDCNPAAGNYQVPDFDINYGLGDRIQLKYEIPIAIKETRPQSATAMASSQPGHVIGGIGESIPGIKWRFYEHHPGDPWLNGRFGTGLLTAFVRKQPSLANEEPPGVVVAQVEPGTNLSVSTYPQLILNNPTRAVSRGLVETGPNFLLPIEINARFGPIRVNAEGGYYFGNQSVPQSWIRGLLVGHEFTDSTEAYLEIYDQQEANRVSSDSRKQRETTLGIGGRHALDRTKTLNLLLMCGRSFQAVSAENSQPSWIAYAGLQVLFGPK